MNVEEFYIEAADGAMLYGKCWSPNDEIEAVLLVLHDISDHINRYEQPGIFFTDNHVAVLGLDQHGHGKSQGKRGHIGNDELIISNVQELAIEARKRFNDQPLFIFGQGMGGTMALNYLLRQNSKEFSGLILSSPLLTAQFGPGGLQRILLRFIGIFFPSYTFHTGFDPEDLSHDPETGNDYRNDKLVHGMISIKLYNQINRSGMKAHEKINLLNYPALIMYGDDNRISSMREIKKLTGPRTEGSEVKMWAGYGHELLNEKNNNDVYRYILDWINKINK